LYPAARKRMPDGAALVKEAKSEHRQLKRVLQKIDKAEVDDPRVDALMVQARDAVRQHVAEEEGPGGILAGLRAAMSRSELADLGAQLRRAKRAAPTHPHPNAPDSPPANMVVGTAAAAVDRVRDRASGRTRRTTSAAGKR